MDEKAYRAMVDRAAEKAEADREKARAASARREALLSRAIQTNRVRVDYVQVNDTPDAYNPRARFEGELKRLLQAAADPSEQELAALLDQDG